MQTKLLIDGQLVAGAGAEVEVAQPGYRAAIAKIREASSDQVNQAVEAAGRAFKSWGNTTPQESSLLLLKLADRIEQDAGAYADLESLNCGKPRARALGDEMPAIVDCFRFFAGAARCLHGQRHRRVSGQPHQHDPPRPGRRGGADHAVELPADDGGVEDRAGAGGGQHRGAQALGNDAAHHAQARRTAGRNLPERRDQHRQRPRRHGRLAADQSPRACA